MSIEVHKFKRWNDVGFCKRHKYLAKHLNGVVSEGLRFDIGYEVDPGSIELSDEGASFLIKSVHETEWKLQGRLSVYEDEITRFTVKEVDPLYPRYHLPDEDLISKQSRLTSFAAVNKHDDAAEFVFKRLSVVLQYRPLHINVLFDGTLVTSLNHKGLFSFERYRKQDIQPEIDVNDTDPINIIDASEILYEVEGGKERPSDLWHEKFRDFTDTKRRGPSSVAMDVTFYEASQLYGLPEHSDTINLHDTEGGEPYRHFNLDVFEYDVDSRQSLYGAIPFMIAKRGEHACGFFWNNPSNTYIDIETVSTDKRAHWMSEAGVIDVFVLPSHSIIDLVSKFTLLTGPPAMPLLASLGFHQCRWNYNDQEDTLGVVSNFDRHNLPLDFIWLDIEHTVGRRYFTWDLTKFPNPTEMQNTLAEGHRNLVTIIDPHLKRDYEYSVFSEALGKGLFVKTPEATDYEGHCWPGNSSWLDYLRPEVRAYWASRYEFKNYQHSTENLHVWNDMNEPSVFSGPEMTLHGESVHGEYEHREVHNVYGAYMHKATALGLYRRTGGVKRPFVLSRSFYAGSQKFGAIWTGDNAANWNYLRVSIPMCLTIALGGLSFCGADIGGFFGNPEPLLNVRWHQLGVFYPFMRAHAHLDARRREPWLFGEPHLSYIRQALHMRYSLLSYLYTAFYHHHTAGVPIIRPLFMEFPQFPEFETDNKHFMFGPSLYVVPVMEAQQREAKVNLPTAPWYDFYDWRKYDLGIHDIYLKPDRIPVFVKGGSILFKQETLRRSSELMKNDPYSVYIALDAEGSASGQLYIDDGKTYSFESGDFILGTLQFSKHSASYSCTGSYPGTNSIDKILIAGLDHDVKRVGVSSEGDTWQAGFYKNAGAITIKLPRLKVNHEWSLSFEFEA